MRICPSYFRDGLEKILHGCVVFSRCVQKKTPTAHSFRVDYKLLDYVRNCQKEVIIPLWLRFCLSVVGLGIFN